MPSCTWLDATQPTKLKCKFNLVMQSSPCSLSLSHPAHPTVHLVLLSSPGVSSHLSSSVIVGVSSLLLARYVSFSLNHVARRSLALSRVRLGMSSLIGYGNHFVGSFRIIVRSLLVSCSRGRLRYIQVLDILDKIVAWDGCASIDDDGTRMDTRIIEWKRKIEKARRIPNSRYN